MNFLHYDFQLSSSDSVRVALDKQAIVRLLDDMNFSKYKRGQRHTHHGGLAKQSPIYLQPPCAGHWHVVIDLGGYSGTVKASVSVVRH